MIETMSGRSSPLALQQNQRDVSLTVALRIRPLSPEEKEKGATQVAYRVDDRMVVLLDPGDNLDDVLRQKRSREKRFIFDVAFGPEATQEEVYEKTTQQLIDHVVNGYNATVFAYGATGAGKTFTMIGTETNCGIMARAMNDLFQKIQHDQEHSSYSVKMSYLEIYNEMIRDLLQPSSGFLDVREDAKGGILVAGLTETSTTSPQEIMHLLVEGNKRRTQEPTVANQTSSRSHAILQVTVTQKSRIRGLKSANHVGRLFLIDLAGSERASHTQNTGQRLKEGAHINRSLLALGNVINTLADKGGRYINYRDSKLTRLLKDSLGGNSRTVMIANISPSSAQFEESRNTLIYADRAKNISNKVSRNNESVTYHVTQYQSIISELRKEIARLKAKVDEQNGLPAASGLMRSESALSFLRDKQSLDTNGLKNKGSQLSGHNKDDFATSDHLPPISNGLSRRSDYKYSNHAHPVSSEFNKLRNEMIEIYRLQMQQRQKLLALNEKAFDIALQLSDKHWEFNETANESDQHGAGKLIRREIEILEKKQKELDHQRVGLEWDLSLSQKKGKKLEQALPLRISANEEKEMLNYVIRFHEAEVEKIALQSDAMLLQKRLQRQESSLRRLRDYTEVADRVISGQQELIQSNGSHTEWPQRLRNAMDDYQMKRRKAEVYLEPLDTRASVMGRISWNRSNLGREQSMREGRVLNKTLNAAELQTLKRMSSMLERERSDVVNNVHNPQMRRPDSAGSLARIPKVETKARSKDDSTVGRRWGTTARTNWRRNSDSSLRDIRTLARARRNAAMGNGVSWKNPISIAFSPNTSVTKVVSPDTTSLDSPASETNSLKKVHSVKKRGRVLGQPAPVGLQVRARSLQRISKSRKKSQSGSRRNSPSPTSYRGAGTSRNIAPLETIGTKSAVKRQPNPNRRIRSPNHRLPVIR